MTTGTTRSLCGCRDIYTVATSNLVSSLDGKDGRTRMLLTTGGGA